MRDFETAARHIFRSEPLHSSNLGIVIKSDARLNWKRVEDVYETLSAGEQAMVCAAATLGNGPAEYRNMPLAVILSLVDDNCVMVLAVAMTMYVGAPAEALADVTSLLDELRATR